MPNTIEIGQQYNYWSVIGRAADKHGSRFWLCECRCGTRRAIRAWPLSSGRSQSCGCLKSVAAHNRGVDLSGKTFGRLTVISLDPTRSPTKQRIWNCSCVCGVKTKSRAGDLVHGKATSCGCVRRERATATNRTHGMSNTGIYHTWQDMKNRCYNPNATGYENYGGRGITVCMAWLESFESFYKDMGDPPFVGASIDRRNNNERYAPGNCRWATATEQSRNRRNNVRLTINGISYCSTELADMFGIPIKRVRSRMRRGQSLREALDL